MPEVRVHADEVLLEIWQRGELGLRGEGTELRILSLGGRGTGGVGGDEDGKAKEWSTLPAPGIGWLPKAS